MIRVAFPVESDHKLTDLDYQIVIDCDKHQPTKCIDEQLHLLETESHDSYFVCEGRIVYNITELPQNGYLQKYYRLRGGKGGFGSMLRAIGSQIEKTTNHEMCRDLSGRRMRDVNMEKKLQEWYANASERERKKMEEYNEKRRKRREVLEKGPLPGHKFSDREYERQKRKIAHDLRGALDAAIGNILKDKPSGSKAEPDTKRSRLWIEKIDDVSISDSSSESSCIGSDGSLDEFQFVSDNNDKGQGIEVDSSSSVPLSTEKSDELPVVEDSTKPPPEPPVLPLTDEQMIQISSVDEMTSFGLDVLKVTLLARGLKCGGTLQERAARLFSVKDLQPDQYPSKLLSKPKQTTPQQ